MRYINILSVLIASLLLFACGEDDPVATVNSERIDQSFEGDSRWSSRINGNSPIGQEFTPGNPGLDFVELQLRTEPTVTGDEVVWVKIREETITGTLVANSDSVIAIGIGEGTRLHFSPRVTLTTGNKYVIEILANSERVRVYGDIAGGYDGGAAITRGIIVPDADLWFQTGRAVP